MRASCLLRRPGRVLDGRRDPCGTPFWAPNGCASCESMSWLFVAAVVASWRSAGKEVAQRGCSGSLRFDLVVRQGLEHWTRRLRETPRSKSPRRFFPCGYTSELWLQCLRVDANQYFDDAAARLCPGAENMIVLANPVQPRSEGEIVLESADPAAHPAIRMNYFGDPHDMKVMLAVIRRCLDVVAHWPAHRTIGPLLIPPFLAEKHGHVEGNAPSDALLEDFARHYAFTVYHPTTTCRIGSVVDPRLHVMGVERLRVADASVMPNVVSGNTNAASIMIGEKAAEMLAADHGVQLAEFVGESPR